MFARRRTPPQRRIAAHAHRRRGAVTLGALLVAAMLAAAPAAAPAANASPPHAQGTHGRTAHAGRRANAQRSCANADTAASAASQQAMRTAVVCLIDQQRVAHHLPTLNSHPLLDHSAQQWTNEMVSSGQFTHGADFSIRITAAGFDWSAAGENIATGYRTPRQVVRAWMASTDHCQNVLNPSYANVGTGVSTHTLGRYGPSTWTQDFGLRMGHQAPSGNHGPAHGCPYRI
jgi:uncharacterized protein YkwD